MLLKSLIFHYHGLDEDEAKILSKSADDMKAQDEMKWANDFIAEDYLSAFDRSKEYLSKTIGQLDKPAKLKCLLDVWEDNNQKGYLTEMEVNAMINLAKDWGIHKDLMERVRDA